jgi:hypothetical protein
MPALTINEKARLVELERTIGKGLANFVLVGWALLEVRDARLYREGFGSFEQYCCEKWGLGKVRAYQLIRGAAVVKALPQDGPLPANEQQARELGRLPEEKRQPVWEAANANGARPTAARIRALGVLEPERGATGERLARCERLGRQLIAEARRFGDEAEEAIRHVRAALRALRRLA